MSTIDRIGIRRVAVERATVISGQSFDTVLAKLAAAVGHPDMSAFGRAVVAARTSADLERIVEAATGPAGLMEMAHFDIGAVLRKELGNRAPKSVRLVIGNPLISKEMVKHVPDAASYATRALRRVVDGSRRDDGGERPRHDRLEQGEPHRLAERNLM